MHVTIDKGGKTPMKSEVAIAFADRSDWSSSWCEYLFSTYHRIRKGNPKKLSQVIKD